MVAGMIIMSKKDEINKNYWNAVKRKQIREEYERYLNETSSTKGVDAAYLFAMTKIKEEGGSKYLDHTEREIILLLECKLPDFYD